MAKRKLNWLQDWKPFIWNSKDKRLLKAKKNAIQSKVTIDLANKDSKEKKVSPRAKTHKITFIWHKGIEDPNSFILVAHLTPAPKLEVPPGGGDAVINPRTPPQPGG